MDRVTVKQELTAKQELKALDQKAEQMRQGYAENKETYYLMMLKAIARKQEQLCTKVKS